MLVVSINLLPQGDFRASRTVGTLEIWNDETGSEAEGNYIAQLIKEDHSVARRVRLEGVPRGGLEAHWRLVQRALAALFEAA